MKVYTVSISIHLDSCPINNSHAFACYDRHIFRDTLTNHKPLIH